MSPLRRGRAVPGFCLHVRFTLVSPAVALGSSQNIFAAVPWRPDMSTRAGKDALTPAKLKNKGRAKQPSAQTAPLKCVSRTWIDVVSNSAYSLRAALDERQRVTFMTYNVLSQSYVSSKVFPTSPSRVLRAKSRSASMIANVAQYVSEHKVDVLCLQELDETMCVKLQNELQDFDGVSYKQRTTDGGRNKQDGSAVFWRTGQFKVVEKRHVELNTIVDDEGFDALVEKKSDAIRDCVSTFVCLQDVKTELRFVVSSAHLYWNPEHSMVKLAQAVRVRAEAVALASKHDASNIVLTGDWNSCPGSAVLAALEGRDISVSDTYVDCKKLTEEAIKAVNEGMRYRLQNAIDYNAGGTLLTTYTHKFQGALDHVLFSTGTEGKNAVAGHLSLPKAKDFRGLGIPGLPWEGYPSDHLPVVVSLLLLKQTTRSS